MSENEMDYADFVEMATALVSTMIDRIPQGWRDSLAGEIEYGIQVPGEFMNLLIKVLVQDQVPITPAERDTVVRLMNHRKMSLEPIDRLNVVAEASAD